MPYTVKVVTSCLDDTTLSDAEQIALIKNFYNNDLPTYPDLAEIRSLKQQQARDGNLLSRAAVISTDGKEIHNVQVWKSMEAQKAYRENPLHKNYMVALRKVFKCVMTVISPPVTTKK